MISRIICCLFILTLIGGCGRPPQPFQLTLEGHEVQFPTTASALCAAHPDIEESLLGFMTKTYPESRFQWRFRHSIKDPKSQPHGVLITLINKADRMDSLRTFFENKYHLPFEPWKEPKHLGKYEYYEPDSTLRIMQVNDDVQLAISRRKIWPHSGYQYTDDVIISISYDLSETEQERFAVKQGDIHVRD
jgi:hypothetical protein